MDTVRWVDSVFSLQKKIHEREILSDYPERNLIPSVWSIMCVCFVVVWGGVESGLLWKHLMKCGDKVYGTKRIIDTLNLHFVEILSVFVFNNCLLLAVFFIGNRNWECRWPIVIRTLLTRSRLLDFAQNLVFLKLFVVEGIILIYYPIWECT